MSDVAAIDNLVKKNQELKKEILKKATMYKEQIQSDKKKRNKSRLYSQ